MRTYLSIFLLLLAVSMPAQVTTFPSNVTVKSLTVSGGPPTIGQVLTSTGTNGSLAYSNAAAGGGALVTNANQFGASTTLTVKDGALLTNLTFVTSLGTLVLGVWDGRFGISNVTLGQLSFWLEEPDTGNEWAIGGVLVATNITLTAIPGTGTNVGITAAGSLFRTTVTGGSGSTQMVTAAIGTLTVSNTFSVPIFNTITGNFAFINLTNFLGSNQVRIGVAQITNVQLTAIAEGHGLFYNAANGVFTNAAPTAGGNGSSNMPVAWIGTLNITNVLQFMTSNTANIGSFSVPAQTNYANDFFAAESVFVNTTGTNTFGPSTFTAHISAPTNIANFVLTTNNFVLDTYYTNSAQRSFVSAVIGMTNVLATEKAMVALYLDQNGDGDWERTGINCRLQGVIALAGAEQLTAFLQPSARFIFTNLGTAANASIEANSSQWVRQ